MPNLALADFHRRVAAGERPACAVDVQFRLAPMAETNVEDRAIPFVFSDDSIDSYNDRIDAKGWQFDRSGAGTIALFGHDPSKIENIIGRAHNVRIEGNRLLGDIHFATKEENPNAEIVYQMVKGGYINSVSVGFEPLEWKQAKDPKRPGGIDFVRQKLREISVVGLPANTNALVQARAAGIDVDRLFHHTRSGRVFSAANEVELRTVREGLGNACDALDRLLGQLDGAGPGADDQERAARLREMRLLELGSL